VGGFSLPAWLAYAVAEVLEQRGVALGGVILLDPVDPFIGTYRWPWRRKLARIWRLIPRRWIRSQDNQHRLLVKSWRQHLLGRWIEESACKTLNAPLHVLASEWRGGLSTKRAQVLQSNPLTLHLATSDHKAVVKQPELIEQWVNYIWQTLGSSSTAKKQKTDQAEKGRQDAT
jgi:thioesterase domain-containing protein